MSVFPPEFTETLSVTADVFIIAGFVIIGYAYYRYLPNVITRIGTMLAQKFLQGLFSILRSQKMQALGEKGVAAREFEAMLKTSSGEDPVKEILAPIASGFVQERFGKKAAGAGEMALSALPVNLTDIALPKVADFLDQKWPQLKLSEQLRALKVISGAEPVK